MKKILVYIVAAVFMFVCLTACDIEPLFSTYGDSVHKAVKEFYSDYEILELVRFEKGYTVIFEDGTEKSFKFDYNLNVTSKSSELTFSPSDT